MKILFLFSALLLTCKGFTQTENAPCSGMPLARPEVKASISGEDVVFFLETSVSESYKKGAYSAVYKLWVDCNGHVSSANYQSGNFSEEAQDEYRLKILRLEWKPATNKGTAVNSLAFIAIDIVNGKFTVTIS